MKELIKNHILEHRSVLDSVMLLDESIEKVANLFISCLEKGGTIFWCGNGGSASDCQHLAGELVGRFVNERRPLKSIALTADSAVMTCIVNDYGYDVINAFKVAENKGMQTIGLLGKGGGMAKTLVHKSIIISSKSTARTQEMHILIGHILCDLIEEGLNLKR